MKKALLACAATALAGAGMPAHADGMTWSLSGFGTAGVAVSDKSYNYQRFIGEGLNGKRDSIVGAQIDTQFNAEWAATVQAKLAPSARSDGHWSPSISWAFLSWRPSNDWLVRAGKLRIPLYLFSENLDVGQSYDFARMPNEMYSISPTTDIYGGYITRNWQVNGADLSLDVYNGRAHVPVRGYSRDAGADFFEVIPRITGSVLTWRSETLTWRIGMHHVSTRFTGGQQFPSTLQAVPSGPGLYFYLPTAYTGRISNDVFTVGADYTFAPHWRVLAEFERDIQHHTQLGANTVGGYVSLLHTWNRWTPYVLYSQLQTVGQPARTYEALQEAYVPAMFDPTGQLTYAQRRLADSFPYYADQHSLSLGTSFALTPHSKLKGEWMHTWVGKGSTMIDSPPGGPNLSNEGIDVLSFSYNFAF